MWIIQCLISTNQITSQWYSIYISLPFTHTHITTRLIQAYRSTLDTKERCGTKSRPYRWTMYPRGAWLFHGNRVKRPLHYRGAIPMPFWIILYKAWAYFANAKQTSIRLRDILCVAIWILRKYNDTVQYIKYRYVWKGGVHNIYQFRESPRHTV